MANQIILFTAMPRGISVDSERMPLSVYVSPRLFNDTQLSAFPDWLNWTRLLKERGLGLTFRCEGVDTTVGVNPAMLKPELWEAMFKETTLVRSHTFDDYSERSIVSYSHRTVLSLLKGLYQRASVDLALPDRSDRQQRENLSNYDQLQELVGGLAVNWDNNLRNYYRNGGKEELQRRQLLLRDQPRDADGLYQSARLNPSSQLTQVHQAAAQEFSVYHHLPPGQEIADNPPDFDTLLDFHQALSSLNSYPNLLRALGLVLDFTLPKEAIPLASEGRLSVVAATPGWDWSIPTSFSPQETVYAHVVFDASSRFFLAAPNPDINEALGLLNLDPQRFGLAQVDVDGGMHKTMMLAATVQDKRDEQGRFITAPETLHPEVFDPRATLPSLRSGGFSLFVDERGSKLLRSLQRSKNFQDATTKTPPETPRFYAEDLIHGYRLDIWDSHTNQWHSLHRRNSIYTIEDKVYTVADEEGFTQLAAAQPAPNPENPPAKDIYLHEAIARWAGWSLSVPFPGRALSSDPDPAKALDESSTEQNAPATPFKMTANFTVVAGSLPSLRFGCRYRIRARVVDLCGNSLTLDQPLLDQLLSQFALPQNPEGFVYLRYEPVISPQIVLRDSRSVTDPGSQLDRLVIRTYNSDPSRDEDPADLTASDRHILPPRTSVEMAERMGMLDDATGKLNPSPAMYSLLTTKDGAELNPVTVSVAGQDQTFPLEASERIDTLPYIPDVLARAAALRDLPGTTSGTLGMVQPGAGATVPVPYYPLNDPNPRPGSTTLISFGSEGDWQTMQPFRLALDEGNAAPQWDTQNRVLTVFVPKGTSATVPLTSALHPDELKLMGIWQWLREYLDQKTAVSPDRKEFEPGQPVDAIAHILQRAVEGGHWMLTPPHLLTLIHAVQQPLGVPTFQAIPVQHEPYNELRPDPSVLQTAPEVGVNRMSRYTEAPTPMELNAITAWRTPGSTDVYLLGGLHIHAASTAKVDLLAEWEDKVDDLSQPIYRTFSHAAPVDEIPLQFLQTHLVQVTPDNRTVAYYAADHDLLCFVRKGDRLGNLGDLTDYPMEKIYPNKDGIRPIYFAAAAPRHQLNDTKHRQILYTARSTSRYRDYFPQDQSLNFVRTSAAVVVDIPASTRPIAPQIAYVIPTFGWQRQTQTNLKRSVRFGGLRVYLERPWYSSGDGELLGVALYSVYNNDNFSDSTVRDQWKSFVTQWGNDPIWQTQGLTQTPGTGRFTDALAQEYALSLEEDSRKQVDVVGYPVAYDEERKMWYCDLTIDAFSTYAPFVRLALVRYQPCALADAKLSRVVLADFAQLPSDRAAVIIADPYHPRQLQVTISGVKPDGPLPQILPFPAERVTAPTKIEVEVQQYDDPIGSDLAWNSVETSIATVQEGSLFPLDPSVLWSGTVTFTDTPSPGRFRLLIREYEYISAEYTINPDGTINPMIPSDLTPETRIIGSAPRRLVYAETVAVDAALISQSLPESRQTKLDGNSSESTVCLRDWITDETMLFWNT
jgi:hypothetical protein